MKRQFRIMLRVPQYAKDIQDELNDREMVLISLIQVLHNTPHASQRRQDTIYNMADRDFQNILGLLACIDNPNNKLETIRKVLRIAQKGGYWSLQWKPIVFDPNKQVNKGAPPTALTYITCPKAIAIHTYIKARIFSQAEPTQEWYQGQDLDEFYSKPLLSKTEYTFMKLRDDLY